MNRIYHRASKSRHELSRQSWNVRKYCTGPDRFHKHEWCGNVASVARHTFPSKIRSGSLHTVRQKSSSHCFLTLISRLVWPISNLTIFSSIFSMKKEVYKLLVCHSSWKHAVLHLRLHSFCRQTLDSFTFLKNAISEACDLLSSFLIDSSHV